MGIAHARIEHPETGEIFEPGDKVPAKLPGLEELRDAGSVSDEPYDQDPVGEALREAQIGALEHELKELREQAKVDRDVSSREGGTASDRRSR